MLVTEFTRRALAVRREARRMEAAGYRKHETDWEIHRGGWLGEVIVDAQVSACGRYVWTKLGKPAQRASIADRAIEVVRVLAAQLHTCHDEESLAELRRKIDALHWELTIAANRIHERNIREGRL